MMERFPSAVARSAVGLAAMTLALLALVASRPAAAGDGRVELSQVVALEGGVTPPDAAGFPITLAVSGSYVLTSNLELPLATNQPGILVDADDVHIDLNGFSIIGNPAVATDGVDGCTQNALRTTVRNGSIKEWGGRGICVSQASRVVDVLVSDNVGIGLAMVGSGIVEGAQVLNNTGGGIASSAGIAYLERNNVNLNTGAGDLINGFAGGLRFGPGNLCPNDARCSADGRKAFYLGTAQVNGSAVISACDDGFHAASIWELQEPTQLTYDAGRGQAGVGTHDRGQGALGDTGGWVRTGMSKNAANTPGRANCNGWSSALATDFGTTLLLGGTTGAPALDSVADFSAPWAVLSTSCNSNDAVWCIQD